MRDHLPQSIERMESMLHQCRRRVMLAKVSVCLREGLGLYLKCLVGIAGIFLALRILNLLVAWPGVINWGYGLATATILAALIFGRALALAIWGKPVHLTHAAERLDLSQITHNRIATAMALLRAGDHSPFATAAIADGFEYLERLQGKAPQVELATGSWRRQGAYLGMSLAMVLIALLVKSAPRPRSDDLAIMGTTPAVAVQPRPETTTPEVNTVPKEALANRNARERTTPPPSHDPSDKARDQRAQPGQVSRTDGPASQQASGKSRTSQSASNSSSAASGAGVKSEPGDSDPDPPKKVRDAKKQTAQQAPADPKADPQDKKGGSISARGSSGASTMQSAQNEWSSEVKAKSSDSDDPEKEDVSDENPKEDSQRLGAQPVLKSRTSNVNRELSLAMGLKPENAMMKGRSGPSAQKKSRGTATMIMGVPVPGFVKGRLLPGPTKSTQEEVEPTPREGDYAGASALQAATPEETQQEHYRPSAALSGFARDYLIQHHTTNDNQPNRAAPNK